MRPVNAMSATSSALPRSRCGRRRKQPSRRIRAIVARSSPEPLGIRGVWAGQLLDDVAVGIEHDEAALAYLARRREIAERVAERDRLAVLLERLVGLAVAHDHRGAGISDDDVHRLTRLQ